jgi:L,D-peptidoglycan transpeptidase YkuD (ErfK/YbiS/YcfS/YnhG family)
MTWAEVYADGRLCFAGRVLRCALGRGGVSGNKSEGDGATPAGRLPLRRLLWRADRLPRPRAAVAVAALHAADGWCDDPRHGRYNTQVRLPFSASHECLWREDGLYDIIGVLGWNDQPVVVGRGSAIFLHVAAADFAATAGCVALSREDLLAVLAAGLSGLVVLPP